MRLQNKHLKSVLKNRWEVKKMEVNKKTMVILDKTFKQGFSAVPLSVLRGKLPKYLKLLYIDLLTYAWEEAQCYPGHKKLAEDLGLTRRAIITNMKKLKELGLISWDKFNGMSNVYTINELPDQFFPKKRERHDNISGVVVKQSSQEDVKWSSHKHNKNNIIQNYGRKNSFSAEVEDVFEDVNADGVASGERGHHYDSFPVYPQNNRLAEFPEIIRGAFEYYFEKYQIKLGFPHPKLKLEQLERAANNLYHFDQEKGGFQLESWKILIDCHFDRDYHGKNNYNLNAFTGKILEHRFEEAIYSTRYENTSAQNTAHHLQAVK